MNAAQFEAGLRGNPMAFLRHHVFFVAGLPSALGPRMEDLPELAADDGEPPPRMTTSARLVPPGQGRFRIAADTATFEGFQTGLAGRRNETKIRDKFNLRPADGPVGGPVFDAWYVPMTDQYADAMTSYVALPGLGGPDVALTSQLSGCTFGLGMAARDGTRIVSHTQPNPAAPAQAGFRHATPERKARFGPMEDIFSRTSRPGPRAYGTAPNRVTVIGIRVNGSWSFYAQTYRTHPNQLLSVERLGR